MVANFYSRQYSLRPVSFVQRSDWDAFVSKHSQGHLLQSWGWGELKASSGWHPLRLALWDGSRIVAGAQVLRKTAPHVPLRLGHLAYIPKGPVLDWGQAELCKAFFMQLNAYLRAQGALALHIEPAQELESPPGELVLKRLAPVDVHSVPAIQPLRTIVLDLAADEAVLLAQMKEKWRYNIRLGARKGVKVRVASSLQDVRAWYALLQTTGERDQFGVHTLDYYLRAWQIFAPDDCVRLFLAEYEGQLLAGIFVGLFARQGLYLYGASSNEQRQLMPNYVLQWEAIRWAKRQGARLYDFWGIPETDEENEAMAGVYRFKRGWGGRVVRFSGCLEHAYHPLAMQIARKFL
ncbi:MAG: peptidoglycan bridge formation glycyltransferase FemA/FemB family protein [Ktedonobacteraceae bacterium]|nr:peptidoglycan bridge formation glycyltransferase FemA/FemB family protein [Ktedonobacteraceae bacterium]